MILQDRYIRAIEALKSNNIDIWISLGREGTILDEPSLLYLMPAEVMGLTAIQIRRLVFQRY